MKETPQYVLFLKQKLFSNKGEEFSVRVLASARFFWEDTLSVCLDDLSPPPPYVARLIKRRFEVILCLWPSRVIGLSGETSTQRRPTQTCRVAGLNVDQ